MSNKKIRVCFWDAEKRSLSAQKLSLEDKLRFLGDIEFYELSSLEDEKLSPCELLIVSAQHLSDDQFKPWVDALRRKIKQQGKIQIPALIFAHLEFHTLNQLLVSAAKSNWYFDILDPQHLSSLPIRVANLLRIHDHLHELKRYDEELTKLGGEIATLKTKLNELNFEKAKS